MGVPQNGWFIRENPIKIRMMSRGTPILGNHHILEDTQNVQNQKCHSILVDK